MSIAEWIYSYAFPWEEGAIQAKNLGGKHTRWGIGPWHNAVRHRRTGEVRAALRISGNPGHLSTPEATWPMFDTL